MEIASSAQSSSLFVQDVWSRGAGSALPSSGDYGGREGVLGKGVGQDFGSSRCKGVEKESGGLAKEGDPELAGKKRTSWDKSGGGGGSAKALGGRKNRGLAGARGGAGTEIRKQAGLCARKGSDC